jgi:hypothetical protein
MDLLTAFQDIQASDFLRLPGGVGIPGCEDIPCSLGVQAVPWSAPKHWCVAWLAEAMTSGKFPRGGSGTMQRTLGN